MLKIPDLTDVDHTINLPIQECSFDVKLPHNPASASNKSQQDSKGIDGTGRGVRVGVVDTLHLVVAKGNPTSFVSDYPVVLITFP